MMKNKLLLMTSVLVLLFSCDKEKDNPYDNNNENTQATSSYFFSDLERSFVLLNELDSFKMAKNDTDTVYYQVKSIVFDTLTNTDGKEYEDALVRFNRVYPEYSYYKIELGFIHMTRETGDLQYYLTLEKNFDEYADTIETNRIIPYKINEQYETKVLFGRTYHNVYRVEEDSTLDYLGDCFQIRAWISPTEGIVCDEESCEKRVLIE